ncbi:hypothetical protein NLG97_g2917 [Lecanicillium saksenae]|uniref:Uncharacterized protein n=1 Tax=Lecanicillium saksenae TaxID=468837 RepID=A0ACC1QZS7_9HYPO|nr:hypothetical protein NLG97_g2917 [Lecanicillium saksenae]
MQLSSTQCPCALSSSSGVVPQEIHWRHGRWFASKQGPYQFPIDAEERDRLDKLNQFFLLARGYNAFSCPVRRGNPANPTRVLDLGAGTGIWAIQVAEEFLPESQVVAVDLNRIQPAFIPENLRIIPLDIEKDDWVPPPTDDRGPFPTDCDLVHMRLLLGSLHSESWPAVYQKAYNHTAPGGYFEQIELDWEPRWEGQRPKNSALLEWSHKFLEGMDRFRCSARMNSKMVEHMVTAGYEEFEETVIRCCVNPWCDDGDEKRVAEWFNLCLMESIEAMGLAPLVEHHGMTVYQVRELQERVMDEICRLQYHAYFNMHVWTARRPIKGADETI